MRRYISPVLRVIAGTWMGVVMVFITLAGWTGIFSVGWRVFLFDQVFDLLSIAGWTLLLLCPGLALIHWADWLERLPMANPPPTPSLQPVGYVRRHWRGEQSLTRSLWVNTVLASLAFYGTWRFLVNHADDLGLSLYRAPILHVLCFDILPWGLFVVLTVWQLVGLARAATRAVNGEVSFWSWDGARVVRLMAWLALVATFYPLYVHGLPDMYESAFVILEDVTDDKYTLTVRNAGTELEIRGHMTLGLTEDVERILADHPRIKVIQLNSPGGRVSEGEGLFNLIRTHRLVTYSSIGCHSACGLAFIGGDKRYLNKHATIGVHRGWTHSERELGIDTGEALTPFNAINVLERRQKLYYLEAGVDRNFAEQLFANLTVERMKYPSPQELLKAGVVHGVIERLDLVLP